MNPTNWTAAALRLLAALAMTTCAGAHAQEQVVRQCHIDGRVAFQSSPCRVAARIAASSMKPAEIDRLAAPRKRTLADLLRERDGADRGRVAPREFQADGADVLPARMGAV